MPRKNQKWLGTLQGAHTKKFAKDYANDLRKTGAFKSVRTFKVKGGYRVRVLPK